MQPHTYLYAALHWISWMIVLAGGAGAWRSGRFDVALAAAALWVIWVLFGSRAVFFQRYVAVKNGRKSALKRDLQSLQRQQGMGYEYKGRYRALEKTRQQILEAVLANKRLEVEVIQPELDKIEVLLDAFVRTAVAHKKVTQYLEENSEPALAAERARLDVELAKLTPASDARTRENLDAQRTMLDSRTAERVKMAQSVQILAVQLDTIEKTLAFLKTKITAMNTPAELQEEIAGVVSGIEAAERTLRETDAIEAEARRMAQRALVS